MIFYFIIKKMYKNMDCVLRGNVRINMTNDYIEILLIYFFGSFFQAHFNLYRKIQTPRISMPTV